MELYYKSTRGEDKGCSASEAVIKGLCDDGGLFVPYIFPRLSVGLSELKDMDYKQTAYAVLKEFFTDYSEDELKSCIDKAYDDKFDTDEIAPLVKKGNRYFLELFHGPTIAFKDMALSILPHLLTTAVKKKGLDEEIVILTATSGDTGKAALAAFADVPGTRIIVFYPKGGVSRIQELQMLTQKGDNTEVIGVEGNFDDCQSSVKEIFNDEALKAEMSAKGFAFSSANSINIGRLFPQTAYYVWAYARMLKMGGIKEGDEINFSVPTGNFGNILAGYFAKQMGIPINKLICASNENKVLYDFFESGIYDKNREFILTSSPSMDILISSNLERLIYMIAGCDAARNASLMEDLSKSGRYEITQDMRDKLSDFTGGYAMEDEVFRSIKKVYEECGYVMDTHTAVAASVDEKTYMEHKSVIVSTASPFKFAGSVMKAIGKDDDKLSDFELIDRLSEISSVRVPRAVNEIRDLSIRHDRVCRVCDMKDEVRRNLCL